MKEIERKDMPTVSGGTVPQDGPCFPPWPLPGEEVYPRNPTGPLINDPTCPDTAS